MKCRYCGKTCSPGIAHCRSCGGAKPVPRHRKSIFEVLRVHVTIFFDFLLTRKERRRGSRGQMVIV